MTLIGINLKLIQPKVLKLIQKKSNDKIKEKELSIPLLATLIGSINPNGLKSIQSSFKKLDNNLNTLAHSPGIQPPINA